MLPIEHIIDPGVYEGEARDFSVLNWAIRPVRSQVCEGVGRSAERWFVVRLNANEATGRMRGALTFNQLESGSGVWLLPRISDSCPTERVSSFGGSRGMADIDQAVSIEFDRSIEDAPWPSTRSAGHVKSAGVATRRAARNAFSDLGPRATLRAGGKLLSTVNAICPVQPSFKKYSAFSVGQISSTSSPCPFPARGAYRDRHERGMGCGGRGSVAARKCVHRAVFP